MIQRAVAAEPGEMSPKPTCRLPPAAWPFTRLPSITKSTNSPCWLSTMRGWAESILRPRATPAPLFRTRTPRVKGSEGSIAAVKASSPKTSSGRK